MREPAGEPEVLVLRASIRKWITRSLPRARATGSAGNSAASESVPARARPRPELPSQSSAILSSLCCMGAAPDYHSFLWSSPPSFGDGRGGHRADHLHSDHIVFGRAGPPYRAVRISADRSRRSTGPKAKPLISACWAVMPTTCRSKAEEALKETGLSACYGEGAHAMPRAGSAGSCSRGAY
jgi:hypothetical protein